METYLNKKMIDPKSLDEDYVLVYSAQTAFCIGRYPVKDARTLVAVGAAYAVTDESVSFTMQNQTPDAILAQIYS